MPDGVPDPRTLYAPLLAASLMDLELGLVSLDSSLLLVAKGLICLCSTSLVALKSCDGSVRAGFVA